MGRSQVSEKPLAPGRQTRNTAALVALGKNSSCVEGKQNVLGLRGWAGTDEESLTMLLDVQKH